MNLVKSNAEWETANAVWTAANTIWEAAAAAKTAAADEFTEATDDLAAKETGFTEATTAANTAGYDENATYTSYDDWCEVGDTACETANAKASEAIKFFYWGKGKFDDLYYCYWCNDNYDAMSNTMDDYPNYSMFEITNVPELSLES